MDLEELTKANQELETRNIALLALLRRCQKVLKHVIAVKQVTGNSTKEETELLRDLDAGL